MEARVHKLKILRNKQVHGFKKDRLRADDGEGGQATATIIPVTNIVLICKFKQGAENEESPAEKKIFRLPGNAGPGHKAFSLGRDDFYLLPKMYRIIAKTRSFTNQEEFFQEHFGHFANIYKLPGVNGRGQIILIVLNVAAPPKQDANTPNVILKAIRNG